MRGVAAVNAIAGVRRRRQILVLGNGAAGAEKQALALASKLQLFLPSHENVSVAMCRVPYATRLHASLPPIAHVFLARCSLDPWIGYASFIPTSPPDVVIGCGRSTVALCAGFKQAFPSVFNIQIQHPRVNLRYFDAVVAPFHDFPSTMSQHGRPPPSNVHLTPGTVCDISRASLASARQAWLDDPSSWAHLPSPKIAVLVGGSCRGYSFTLDRAAALVAHLSRHAATATFLITFSRRTPPPVMRFLQRAFALFPSVYIWDNQSPNPFMGFLAHAAAIVATPDSISMVTEAIASGMPTFVCDSHLTTGKFERFHRQVSPWVADVASLDVSSSSSLQKDPRPTSQTDPSCPLVPSPEQLAMDHGVVDAVGGAVAAFWDQHPQDTKDMHSQ
ncbi:hypothetical protein H257_10499 [Aphanomyces astaci]|uniref:Mitochondrial fission protein ELM1 n=1 Tax=Aphanomyces astaci TaxID=112090 RepID=W4G8N5_APHAT|nr:hypothetical protein H257_10499 [Aphanomyces astaci]ETV75318.1 hypothetical protein H257_10499 [Aphanomyces astaci]|eukprot:XP_009835366.1 hypothetical protein H257_10499 [Aphanomyces astaci]